MSSSRGPEEGTGCPDPERLGSVLETDPDEALLEHLEDCPSCLRRLEALQSGSDLLPELREAAGRASPAVEPASAGGGFPGYPAIREIGRGGQGTVYAAIQESTRRAVAIKVLRCGPVLDARQRKRIQREVAILGRIAHPGVCPVIDFLHDRDRIGIVMPLLSGQTLAHRIRRAAERPVDPVGAQAAWARLVGSPTAAGARSSSTSTARLGGLHQLVRLMEEIAEAVQVVHEAGVVHRDLKPANVLLLEDGRPVVLDFGLAVDLDADAERITRDGEVQGTPAYMAPEQVRGRLAEIGVRTDVYALGVMLYELLTLRRPYPGPVPAVFGQIERGLATRPRRLVPVIPRDLDAVCTKAMDPEPERRYPSARAFAEDLMRVRRLEPTLAKPLSPTTRLLRRARRKPWAAAALALAVAWIPLGVALRCSRAQAVDRVTAAAAQFWPVYGRYQSGVANEADREFLQAPFPDEASFETFKHATDADEAFGLFIEQHRQRNRSAGSAVHGVDLTAPRAGVATDRPVFRFRAPGNPAEAQLYELTVIYADQDTVVHRWRVEQPAGTREVTTELPPGVHLESGRPLEWYVKWDLEGVPPASEDFVVVDLPSPIRGTEGTPFERLVAATTLVRYELYLDAVESLESFPDEALPVEHWYRQRLLALAHAHLGD